VSVLVASGRRCVVILVALLVMFQSFEGSWSPLLLILAATWMTGMLLANDRARRDRLAHARAAGAR
jgi:hypothetical protein